jgi:hypothetical protein
MQGLLTEGEEAISLDADANVKDAALIGAAQKVEHYEIALYGTLCSWADELGLSDVRDLLHQTLEEEKATDAKLTELAERRVNASARGVMSLWRSSPSGESIFPHDSSARPVASTRRGPAIATSGRASSVATSVSIEPAGTDVSGLSSRIRGPNDCRMPRLFARANPRFAPASMTRTPLHRPRIAAAVPSGDALSTTMISRSIAGLCSINERRQPSM